MEAVIVCLYEMSLLGDLLTLSKINNKTTSTPTPTVAQCESCSTTQENFANDCPCACCVLK
eukprot:m.367705 g.367705  ORF g.367705 m.367705 type:complete len:61 (-) comp42222_c0_seq1:60-242(-)